MTVRKAIVARITEARRAVRQHGPYLDLADVGALEAELDALTWVLALLDERSQKTKAAPMNSLKSTRRP